MGTFLLISGLLMLILSSSYQFALMKEKHDSVNTSIDYLPSQRRRSLSPVAFFQLLGLLWTLFGIAFVAKIIHYPQGDLRILLDILFLLVPIWAFAFYLEHKNKKK